METSRAVVPDQEEEKDPFEGRVDGLYLVLISLHGLVRGERMELGKDPDTGGQVRMGFASVKVCPKTGGSSIFPTTT